MPGSVREADVCGALMLHASHSKAQRALTVAA